ncbi:hypothetical protein SK128_010546 [Halocaridina rubra]|uniref:Hint domain-containing protein n=1 Tax=Halocaridina rubra TaxID=373956 RepID=A0AAN8WLJ5_HALRR
MVSASESSAASKLGGCFPGSGKVMTPSGPKEVSAMKEGDQIQVMKADGSLGYSPILMFLHRDPQASRVFLQLKTAKGTLLTLTSSHLIFLLPNHEMLSSSQAPTMLDAMKFGGAVLAARVEEGDFLLVRQERGGVELEEVVEVTEIRGFGVFAPLTSEGTVVVDGVVASCYAVIDSQSIAHWAFLPVRFYYNLKETVLSILRNVGAFTVPVPTKRTKTPYSDTIFSNKTLKEVMWQEEAAADLRNNEVGAGRNSHIHWYARFLYKLASWLLPAHLVYS